MHVHDLSVGVGVIDGAIKLAHVLFIMKLGKDHPSHDSSFYVILCCAAESELDDQLIY